MYIVSAELRSGDLQRLRTCKTEQEASQFIEDTISAGNEVKHNGVHYWWVKDSESYHIDQQCGGNTTLEADDDSSCGLSLECNYGPENHPDGFHETSRGDIIISWPGGFED